MLLLCVAKPLHENKFLTESVVQIQVLKGKQENQFKTAYFTYTIKPGTPEHGTMEHWYTDRTLECWQNTRTLAEQQNNGGTIRIPQNSRT